MSSTRTCEASSLIFAPGELAWKALSDVAAWPAWLPTVTQVEPLDGRTLAVGRRFVVHQPKLRPATWVVTAMEPARRFAWAARSPGLHMLAEHIVEPQAGGGCRVILRYSFSGWLGVLLAPFFRSLTQRYLASEASALKQLAEGGPARQ